MNRLQFAKLIWAIYGSKKLPNLDWIQELGLLAVKLGQMHALRIDFLDPAKCMHLSQLYRKNNSIPIEDFKTLLSGEAVFGGNDPFESLNLEPLATASIGQVHLARLHNGADVVVKVVKTDARDQFIRDVATLKSMFTWFTRLYPPLKRVGDPVAMLKDIEDYRLSELDLRHELQGQEVLRAIQSEHAERFDLSNLVFPKIYSDLTTENVLVAECIKGPTFDELLEEGKLPYEKVVELFRLHGYFMFCIGTFHGDLHPGNAMLADDRICWVDTGFIGKIGKQLRIGFLRFFAALTVYDYPLCVEALHGMSLVSLDAKVLKRFRLSFETLYKPFTNSTVSEISLTRQMMETIKLGVLFGMRFDKSIFAIIRSLMYMDGMVLRCNPKAVLMRDMRGFIDQIMRREDIF